MARNHLVGFGPRAVGLRGGGAAGDCLVRFGAGAVGFVLKRHNDELV